MHAFLSVSAKCLGLGIITWAFCYCCFGQYPSDTTIWKKLIDIEKDTSLSIEKKLPMVLKLKKLFEDQKIAEDSVYARILHRIGVYEFLRNHNVATNKAINFTIAAVRINTSGKKNNSAAFCVNSHTNLANYYRSLHLYNLALQHYDSALMQRERLNNHEISAAGLILEKAQMLYRTGDYQKATEEFNFAVLRAKANKDSSIMPVLLNHRAQTFIRQGRLQEALADANTAGDLSTLLDNQHEKINSTFLKADIYAKRKDFSKVLPLYNKGIKERLTTTNYSQISDDYTDYGNIYLDDLHNYAKARDCYLNTIKYALKAHDFERLSKGHINLEQCSFRQQNYKEAEQFCIEAMKDLKVITSNNILINPTATRLTSIGNKDLVLVILGNKTELLLQQYIETNNKKYLSACLQTSLLTDTLITTIRHEQSGEQSKLYWRNRTREFFTHAMEACYLANDARLAFYFMEKSRAVLLNDKLNELGASAHLPQEEAAKEHEFQIAVISEQQKLTASPSNETAYEAQQSQFLQAKANLERYIRSLEKNILFTISINTKTKFPRYMFCKSNF